jgi:molybdopterin converting factor small subunit
MKNTALLKIPSYFQPFMDWKTEMEIPTGTVGDALNHLFEQYPQMKPHIYTYWGILSANILFYVNEDEIFSRQGLDTPLEPGDRLILVPTASGG